MVISHKYKYLFVELPRTGTTSISKELCKNYGGKKILFKHATYRDFFKVAAEHEKKYFVFSCLRNPLDRTVSLHLKLLKPVGQFANPVYRKRLSMSSIYFNRRIRFLEKNNGNFSEYFKKFYKIPYEDWSSLDHKRFDFILRFENLQEDFSKLLKILSIDQKSPLPGLNKTKNKEKSYLDYYTPETIGQAKKIFGPFMIKNGFEFPEHWGSVKITRFDLLNYYFWSFIRKFYYIYLRNNR